MIHRPKVFDVTKDTEAYGVRHTSEIICQQLTMIDEHNDKIPPRKKDKDSLPEISSTNVNAKYMMKNDLKKKAKDPDYKGEYIRKYHNIGFVDGATSATIDNPIGGISAFSVTN